MMGIRRRNARTLAFVVGLALVGIVPLQARASHGQGSTLEQRWELLAEQVTGVTSTKHVRIERGSLPGGTTKLDPAPTATFEVVGAHTGGQGASHYDVELRDQGGTVLASVPHGSGAGTFARRTAPLSWPGTNTRLYEIRILKVNVGVDLAGTFDLGKVSILLHQEGTVRKTVARLPLAVRQDTIISTGWAELAEPIRYTHAAADFDPAPTITLRTTGMEKTQAPVPASFHVRLVRSDGTTVTGAENIHSGHGSQTSAALSLDNGETYRLQVRVDQNIPPEEGRLDSAELVFEQATTEDHGITRTVAYHPSVAAATDLLADGAELGFLLGAPEIAAPEVDWSLHATVRRVLGDGTARAAIQDQTAPHLPPASVGTQDGSNSSLQSKANLPTTVPGNVLDTEAILDTGTTGRVAQTLLRAAVALRDLFVPEIFFLTPLDRGNVAFASAPLAAKLMDYSGIVAATISFTLHDETAQTSQTFSGTQVTYDVQTGWAKTDPVSFTAGHLYRLEVAAEDIWGNLAAAAHGSVADARGFLAITASAGPANAHIDPTSCTVSSGLATCEDVLLTVDASTATLSGARSHGRGQVRHTVSMEDAVVTTTINGQPAQQSAYDPEDPAWAPRTLTARFVVSEALATETVLQTAPVDRWIGTLTAPVPTQWTSANLELVTQGSVTIDACPDPTAGPLQCVPDPVRFLPHGGTNTDEMDLRGFVGAAHEGGALTAPLLAASPPWLTDAFYLDVLEAGGEQVTITEGGTPPLLLTGIRPGSLHDFGGFGGSSCTTNFIFSATIESKLRYAIGTAAHCLYRVGFQIPILRYLVTSLDPEQPDLYVSTRASVKFPPGVPDVPWPPPESRCPGHFSNEYDGTCPEWDFALLLVPEGLNDLVDASAHDTGAPCGANDPPDPQNPNDPLRRNDIEVLGHGFHPDRYHQTTGLSPGTVYAPAVPREGAVRDWDTPQPPPPPFPPQGDRVGTFEWRSAARGGDSGGPVWMTGSGEAAGIMTHIIGDPEANQLAAVTVGGPRIDRIMWLLDTYAEDTWTLEDACL